MTGGGRIAILRREGTVATLEPDGSDERVVAQAGVSAVHQQLSWSPDGHRLAFGRLERVDRRPARASIVVADADGGDHIATSLATVPFYISWRPDGQAIACLGNGPAGIDLTLVEPGIGARVLLRGSPLFLAWDASGEHLACHVDDERLLVFGDGGRAVPRPLAEADGFGPPVWLDDGVCIDIDDAGRRCITVLDPASGAVVRRIARHDGGARLMARPGASRLAFAVAALTSGRDPGILNEPDEALPEALCVADRSSGGLDVVSASTPVAAEWSPDGTRLLVLVQDSSSSVQWLVWDGSLASQPIASFAPTRLVLETELPFADQYALSRRSWAPDSGAFAWTARGRDRADRLWVATLADGGARSLAITEASTCAWAP